MTSANQLPIQRVTMYKHGVSFVQRRGPVSGEVAELTVGTDALNDVLKSLLIVDHLGGQVTGLSYEIPVDRQTRLASYPIKLADDHSILDMLSGLRGYSLRLVTGSGSQQQEHSGVLIGVELLHTEASLGEILVSILDNANGTITVLPVAEVRQVVLLEQRSAAALEAFLVASRSDETHCVFGIQLSGGEHDLEVSYLVPSPTWRVTYRVVAESVLSESSSKPAGELLLQGWAVITNNLNEDLQDVSVSLVAGQPISFIYDLASSFTPARPEIKDTARVAAAPVEFDDMLGETSRLIGGMQAKSYAMGEVRPAPSIAPGSMARQKIDVKTEDMGELFAYTVETPVTVQRSASALVPILNTRLHYERVLLFNAEKLPKHPVATLWCTNTTGLVLERGPATVIEDGEYHGEAIVSFTKQDGVLYLPFAVELGITVTSMIQRDMQVAGIRLDGAALEIKHAELTSTSYLLANSLAAAQAVTIEHRRQEDADLVDTPGPLARTAEHYRWRISCPARAATRFEVVERRLILHTQDLLDVSYAGLQQYLRDRWLDESVAAQISALLDARQHIQRNSDAVRELQTERDEIYVREDQLRQNMNAMGTQGEEGSFRRSVVANLQVCEERIADILNRIVTLKADSARHQVAIDLELARFAALTPADREAEQA